MLVLPVLLIAACTPEQEAAIATTTAIAQTGNPAVVEVNESFGLGDTPLPVGPVVVTINESFGLGDAPVPLGPAFVTAYESVSLGDTPMVLGPAIVTVAESFSLSDTPIVFPALESTVEDAFSIADSIDIEITTSAHPPAFDPAPAGGMDVKAGEEFLLILPFTDIDPNDTHTGTVDWGDGTTAVAKVDQTQDAAGGDHIYQAAGTYSVTVTITDSSGLSDSVTIEIRAQAAPPPESKDEPVKDDEPPPPPADDGGSKGK